MKVESVFSLTITFAMTGWLLSEQRGNHFLIGWASDELNRILTSEMF